MQTVRMFDWGDLKHFLAVARSGSTLGAGKTLGVNQTTVARRIAALEECLGEKLFDRAAGGYRLTELGTGVLGHAEQVEREILSFERAVNHRSRKLSGVIRVTTNDVFADTLVSPWLHEFVERFPSVRVDVLVTDTKLDLAKGEADIALRAALSPPTGEGVISRTLARGCWALYCSRGYARKHGRPTEPDALSGHAMIGGAGHLQMVEPALLKKAREQGGQVRSSSSSIPSMAASIRSGLGVGALPCILGETDPGLVRCFSFPEGNYDLVLLVRDEMRNLPHVRAFMDFIIARTSALKALIEGSCEPAAVE